MPVLFDSGIRTGRDAFKALALGADAVLIGRPYLYGLALDGQRGTRRVMRSLVDELEEEVRKARHRTSSHPFPFLPDPRALKRSPDMPEHTRRQFLEVAAATAAATLIVPPALAAPRVAPDTATPKLPAKSPLPVGPGAPFGSYQSEIYIAGMTADIEPIFTTNLSDLEAAAEDVLSEAARRHLLAWAGGAAAVRANARALSAWRIVPRMFIDRDERDLSTTVLGVAMPAPVILGPVGRQALVHPAGEIATARAAAGLELTYVHSSRASKSPEEVAVAAPNGLAVVRAGLAGRGRRRPRATHPRAGNRVHPPRALSAAARAGLGGARGDPQVLGRADRPRRHPERSGRADGGPPWLRRCRCLE